MYACSNNIKETIKDSVRLWFSIKAPNFKGNEYIIWERLKEHYQESKGPKEKKEEQ